MARLQELAGRSLVQNLGLQDILEQRRREAVQLGDVERLRGQAEVEGVRGAQNVSLIQEAGKVDVSAAHRRKSGGVFNALSTAGGAAVGFLFGGPAGAKLGADLGSKFGEQTEATSLIGDLATQGTAAVTGRGSELESFQAANVPVAQRQAEANLLQTGAQIAKTQADTSKSQAEARKIISGLSKSTSPKKELSAKDQKVAEQGLIAFNDVERLSDKIFGGSGSARNIAQLEFAGRFASDDVKKYRIAIKSAMDPVIRFRTGAALTESETKFYDNLFLPQVGDSVEVVRFKQKSLGDAIKSMNDTNLTDSQKKEAIDRTTIDVATKVPEVGETSDVKPVSRTADGRIKLSDGSSISREEANRRFGG